MGSWSDKMTFPVKMDQQTKPKVDAQTNLINNVVCGSQNRNNSVESCHKKFVYRTKCFYSKHYNPQDIESSLVRPLDACVKSFKVSLKPSKNRLYSNVVKHGKKHYKGVKNAVHDLNDNPIIGMHSQCVKRDIGENKNNIKVSEDCIELHGNTDCRDRDSVKHLEHVHNVPGGASDAEESDQKLLFDINSCGDDKFFIHCYSMVDTREQKYLTTAQFTIKFWHNLNFHLALSPCLIQLCQPAQIPDYSGLVRFLNCTK